MWLTLVRLAELFFTRSNTLRQSYHMHIRIWYVQYEIHVWYTTKPTPKQLKLSLSKGKTTKNKALNKAATGSKGKTTNTAATGLF